MDPGIQAWKELSCNQLIASQDFVGTEKLPSKV
jgi:hypothetical protein